MPRIALFGKYGQNNLGNDLTLRVAIESIRLRQPASEIICVCSGPEDVASRFSISTIPFRPQAYRDEPMVAGGMLSRARRFLTRSIPNRLRTIGYALRTFKPGDMLVVAGTGILESDEIVEPRWPLEIFTWCLAARVRRARVVFLSIGVGPIPNRISGFIVRWTLRLAHIASYRDTPSSDQIASTGLDTRGHRVVPDIAFLAQVDGNPPPVAEDSRRPYVVGVGVMDYHGQRRSVRPSTKAYSSYLDAMAHLLRCLLDAGCAIRLLCGDTRFDDGPTIDLLNRVQNLGVARHDPRLCRAMIHDNSDLLNEIAGVDIVISPRYHNLIVGLVCERPVIAVSYNDKHDALLQSFGLDDYSNDIDHLDASSVTSQSLRLLAAQSVFASRIRPLVLHCRVSLEEQFDLVFGPPAAHHESSG